ncbi:MAG TPA: hypothetical protein VFZ63_05980 [Jiangellaceae bacterium]
MTSGFGSVGSVLTERPPSDELLVTPVARGAVANPPSHDTQRPPQASPQRDRYPVQHLAPTHHPPRGHHSLLTEQAPLTQQSLLPEPAPPAPPAAPVQSAPSSQPDRGKSTGNRAWYDSLLSGREYDVVYDDAEGYPLLAFADGQWYDVTSFSPRPVSVRYAIHLDPAWAGAVVQTVCSWTRSNPNHDRSFELATELALAVGELARLASS